MNTELQTATKDGWSGPSSDADLILVGFESMIFAVPMLLVALTLLASWRRHALELPLFFITVAFTLGYLITDMTTRLTLSF